jgi:signal transduction histidine kinase
MKEGGTLTVTTKDKDGACELIVSDTGPGIAEQDVPHVFSPFFSTKEQGMGLGLTLAGRIMAQHDGALELLNGNQEGGTFAFHFPQPEATQAQSS